jgi:hypothetical protein
VIRQGGCPVSGGRGAAAAADGASEAPPDMAIQCMAKSMDNMRNIHRNTKGKREGATAAGFHRHQPSSDLRLSWYRYLYPVPVLYAVPNDACVICNEI